MLMVHFDIQGLPFCVWQIPTAPASTRRTLSNHPSLPSFLPATCVPSLKDRMVDQVTDQLGVINIHKLRGNFSEVAVHGHSSCRRSQSNDSGFNTDGDGSHEATPTTTTTAIPNGATLGHKRSHSDSQSHVIRGGNLGRTKPPSHKASRSISYSVVDRQSAVDCAGGPGLVNGNSGGVMEPPPAHIPRCDCDTRMKHGDDIGSPVNGIAAITSTSQQSDYMEHTPKVPLTPLPHPQSQSNSKSHNSQSEHTSQGSCSNQPAEDQSGDSLPIDSQIECEATRNQSDMRRLDPNQYDLSLDLEPLEMKHISHTADIQELQKLESEASDSVSLSHRLPPSGKSGKRSRHKPKQHGGKQSSWLLRLFESKLFDMSIAVQYLFNSKEPGVQSYIGR